MWKKTKVAETPVQQPQPLPPTPQPVVADTDTTTTGSTFMAYDVVTGQEKRLYKGEEEISLYDILVEMANDIKDIKSRTE